MAAARTFRISGLVQGVGFRYYALRRAQERGVVGYVRNLSDGRVEVVAEGAEEALESLKGDLAVGPGAAKVARVEESVNEETGRFTTFTISR
jgi:acylphosphatase